MKKKLKFVIVSLLWLGCIAAALLFLSTQDIAVLNPKGMIALKERRLLIDATLIMLIVVIPVFILTCAFAWRYREGNVKAKYAPDWEHNHFAECVWWGVPLIIIIVLAVLTWRSSHALDPFRPIESKKTPVHIQVVALTWKWLFIYPEQGIATVNFVQFPENTPINFEITSDAPMNSFWIPELGGQIYAMPAMRTKLHLIANEVGTFRGVSSNLSGVGFAGMTFTAKATSDADFNRWVQSVKQSKAQLNSKEYQELVKPSRNNPPAFYLLTQEGLFDQIIMKYKMPMH
ncbi:MAG: ubiquinol oxidase subunit II [Simkaniaceae bacterium]|nr:ubiquinol oxidase subunit II [Simkaniaceae bacterium]